MLILTIRTDKPEAEIAIYKGSQLLASLTWQAHRQLAETLHRRVQELLLKPGLDWQDIEGVIVYKGPGSFTGLRIGLSVANALAYGRQLPIVAVNGENWIRNGQKQLELGNNDGQAQAEYGALPHITLPKK